LGEGGEEAGREIVTATVWPTTGLHSAAELKSFVKEKPFAIVHFDTLWDVGYYPILHRKILDAQSCFSERVSFGEVDCDQSPNLAGSIRVSNVPLVAYYRQGQLIAALTGSRQNVQLRVERLLRGEAIGYRDGADTDNELRLWPYTL
jgi:Thioredoxin